MVGFAIVVFATMEGNDDDDDDVNEEGNKITSSNEHAENFIGSK